MAKKTYHCREFPFLTIAGVCKFENHEYSTTSMVIQSRIEQSQSFTSGGVKVVEEDQAVEVQTFDITYQDLQKMKKAELVEVANAMNVEFGAEATRMDIMSLLAAELRRG